MRFHISKESSRNPRRIMDYRCREVHSSCWSCTIIDSTSTLKIQFNATQLNRQKSLSPMRCSPKDMGKGSPPLFKTGARGKWLSSCSFYVPTQTWKDSPSDLLRAPMSVWILSIVILNQNFVLALTLVCRPPTEEIPSFEVLRALDQNFLGRRDNRSGFDATAIGRLP